MADYSREDSAHAEGIVSRLMSGEPGPTEFEQGLAVSDLEQDARVFSDEMALLEDFDAPCPAARIGDEKVPVSLQTAIGPWPAFPPFGYRRYWRRNPYFYEEMRAALRYFAEGYEVNGFTSMDREQARSTFAKRATDFLATRVAAVRIWQKGERSQPWQGLTLLNLRPSLAGAPAPTPGCHFTVSTNSSGLRVFWSGAYYVSSNNFNSPTTPTTSVLQAGTYIFGVDGGAYGNTIHWDLNLVVSLPGIPYAHLNY